MPKGFSENICVYCNKHKSTPTGDHIIPRSFFLVEDRGDLPKVPACAECNNEKSKIEHYLSSVLPFGGKHQNSTETLTTLVPKRLARNAKLSRELNEGKKHALLENPSGLLERRMTIPFDDNNYLNLFKYIGIGMHWYLWKKRLQDDQKVEAILLTGKGEQFWRLLFAMKSTRDKSGSFANYGFQYRVKCSDDVSPISVSAFSLYGDIDVYSDDHTKAGHSRYVGVLIASKKTIDDMESWTKHNKWKKR